MISLGSFILIILRNGGTSSACDHSVVLLQCHCNGRLWFYRKATTTVVKEKLLWFVEGAEVLVPHDDSVMTWMTLEA
jgi:hypothetical protein